MAKQVTLIAGVKELIQDTTFTSDRILDYLNQGTRQIAGGIMIRYPDGTQVFSSPLPLLSTTSSLTTSTSNAYISLPSDFGRDLFVLVSSTNEVQITVEPSFANFMAMYPNLDSTSQVVCACIGGTSLYYQGMPSTAETLVPYYYQKAKNMESYTASTISFAETGNKISDSADGFSKFKAGQIIDVTGTSSNNTEFTISAVADDYSYMTTTSAPTDEAAGLSFTIKSQPFGIPLYLQEALLENYAAWKIFERKTKNDAPMSEEAARYHGLFMGAMIDMESSIENLPESVQIQSSGVSSWGYGR